MTKNQLAREFFKIYKELMILHGNGENITRDDNNKVFEYAFFFKYLAIRIRTGYKNE